MKLKGILVIGLVIGVLGSIIFFSFQHRLEYTTYKIEETWELEPSLTIMLKEITVKKFMDNPVDFNDRPWYRYIPPHTPNWLIKPIIQFGHFFSMPHRFDSGEIEIKGIVIGDQFWRNKYEIKFWIDKNIYVPGGLGTLGVEGGHTFFFNIKD